MQAPVTDLVDRVLHDLVRLSLVDLSTPSIICQVLRPAAMLERHAEIITRYRICLLPSIAQPLLFDNFLVKPIS